MKNKTSLIALAAFLTVSFTGCGIVKVVPIGEEDQYSGKKTFDSAAESNSDWEAIVSDITGEAQEIADALGSGNVSEVTAVKGTGTITAYNTDTPKHYIVVEVEGYTGDIEVQVRTDGPNSSTAIRDLQHLKEFESFTNQTEWSAYGKALNKESVAQVTEPLGIDENAVGKTVTFAGGGEANGEAISITPVEMTIE
ncbi:MAG: DUF2291 family protein [Eubacteriales bacterium]|nr:DUF2291 family protein [Eubacteriales bacterium]